MAAKRGRGRPPKYDPKRMLPVVKSMAKLGATENEIAMALQVCLKTIDLWARSHPEFLRALKPPKKVADERVERSLFRRATGYQYDSEELVVYDRLVEVRKDQAGHPVFVKEKQVIHEPIVKEVPPDVVACIFWLKNRRRERWRDFKAVEHSTPPDRPFQVESPANEAELIGAYYKRLKQAGLDPATVARSYPAPDSTAKTSGDSVRGVEEGGPRTQGPPGDPPARKG